MDFAVDENAADFFASLSSGAFAISPAPEQPSALKKQKVVKYDYSAQPKTLAPEVKLAELGLPMEERITNLLVPDMKLSDVIQLIKKMKSAGKSDADEFSELDAELNAAPRFVCDACGNSEQHNFITDYARGDTICTGPDGRGCGNVVQDHIVHEGSAYRKFEGEEDKSHHGPAPNKLFSTGHNLRTMISQVHRQTLKLISAHIFP
jgi:hypothetical protein